MPGTKIIDNWSGKLTRNPVGDMNSGFAKFAKTFGNNPFVKIGNLTWFEAPLQIDPSYTVVTDLIMAGKVRLEGGVTYVYAIGSKGRLYKIQVNNPSGSQPNYDTPVLLTTLTINSPTFTLGASIQFYGSTPRIYIGHDIGVTQVNFDGSGESFIGDTGQYIFAPRPSVQFGKILYFGNGDNILSLDSSLTITNYQVFPAALGVNTYVRDLDVSPDGVYMQITVSQTLPPDLTAITQDTNSAAVSDSYLFLWNGIDQNPTSYTFYGSHVLTANQTFGPASYEFGYDTGGSAVYYNQKKILTLPNTLAPIFNSTFAGGSMVYFMNPESVERSYPHQNQPVMHDSLFAFGAYDDEFKAGLYRNFRGPLTFGDSGGDQLVNAEVVQVPMCIPVSNLLYTNNALSTYSDNVVSSAKIYFSAIGAGTFNGNPAVALYKFDLFPTGLGSTFQSVYETQQETSFKLFHSIVSKKFKITSVRFYTEPIVSGVGFKIDLIGSDGNPMNGGSCTFLEGTNCTAGQDYFWYTAAHAPTYSVGVRITNMPQGDLPNWVGIKMELDYTEAGI